MPVVAISCGFKSHLLHFLFAGSLESEGFPFFHFLYSIYCKINSAAFSIPIFPVSIQRSYSLPSPQRVAVHCSLKCRTLFIYFPQCLRSLFFRYVVALLDSLFPYVRIGVEINGHTVRVILVDYVCASADDNTGFLLRDILYKTDISFTRIFGTVAHDKTVKKTVDRFLVQKNLRFSS